MTQEMETPSKFPLIRLITDKTSGVFIADYNGHGYCAYNNNLEKAQAFADWLVTNNITNRNQLNAAKQQDRNLAQNICINF